MKNGLQYLFFFLFLVVLAIHVAVYIDAMNAAKDVVSNIAFGELLGFSLALTASMTFFTLMLEKEDER